MPNRFGFTFRNSYVGQRFVVDDLVKTDANPIWSGFIGTNETAPRLFCTPASIGPGWGRVSVTGQTTAPTQPVVKDIRYDGDEFVYAP